MDTINIHIIMKNLIIVGAGGMGREVYNLATHCRGYNTDYSIKGFIDDNLNSLDKFHGYPSVIETVENYIVDVNDVFVCSIGDVETKKICIKKILDRGGDFINLIHPLAQINLNTKIGKGCIIDNSAYIGSDSNIGDFVLIQIGSVIGHDVTIGDWSRIDCHVVCVGDAIIGNEVCIHTGTVVNHRVKVGNNACIGANSFVVRNVKKGITVYGNPAKEL